MKTEQLMTELERRFPSRRAFITGAASGLGKELAITLLDKGWLVGINDIDADSLARLFTQAKQTSGIAISYPFDVTNLESFRSAAQDFLNQAGGVDVVINAAGIGGSGPFPDYSLDWLRKIMDINYYGTAIGSQIFLESMLRNRSGHIVNIASAAAYHGLPRLGAYSASKAAVVMLSETMKAELEHTGVDVSVMICAFYNSNIWKHTLCSEQERAGARILCETAPLPIEQARDYTLKGMSKRHFYIVVPGIASLIWRFKRFAPNLWLAVVPRLGDLVKKKMFPNGGA